MKKFFLLLAVATSLLFTKAIEIGAIYGSVNDFKLESTNGEEIDLKAGDKIKILEDEGGVGRNVIITNALNDSLFVCLQYTPSKSSSYHDLVKDRFENPEYFLPVISN